MNNPYFIPLIFTFLVGIFSALQGLAYKYAFMLKNRPLPNAAILNLTMGTVALIMLILTPSKTIYTDYRIYVIAVIQGIAFVAAVYLISKASDMGFMSIAWAYLGMCILAVIGGTALFLGEKLYITDAISLAVFVVMIILMQDKDEDGDKNKAKNTKIIKNIICISLFFINAIILIAYKFKTAYFGSDVNSALMATVSGYTAMIVGFIGHFILEKGEDRKIPISEWKGGIAVGLTLIFIVGCNFPAMQLPAAIMFPISQGMSILGGVVLITLVYKEKLTLNKKIGVILAVLIVVLSACRENIAHIISKII